ncbi:hypothetical protein GN956_G10378 [Arapaima gigas]
MSRPFCLLFVVLATTQQGSLAEVVTNFSPHCNDFFYMGKEPEGIANDAVKICQRYKGKYYYATLYSTKYRIPLYSAYTLNPSAKHDLKAKKTIWFIEPQISSMDSKPDMSLSLLGSGSEQQYHQQAANKDYEFSGFDRGHLNPSNYQHDEERHATFTLTNAVPLDPSFNRIHWNRVGKATKRFLHLFSDEGTAYIITGAVPTEERIPRKNEFDEDTNKEYHRVSIPSHIWTAVCYRHSSNKSESFSFAYIGTNEVRTNINVMSIADLSERLTVLYRNSGVTIFEDDCDGSTPHSQEMLEKYQKTELNQIDRFYLPEHLKMIYEVSLSSYGVSYDSIETFQGNYPYISHLEIIDKPRDIVTWFNKVENLKRETKTVCVLQAPFSYPGSQPVEAQDKVDPLEKEKETTCIMLPEKSVEGSVETADGTRCVKGETCSNHKCHTMQGEKECCSSPCLYDHVKNAFMCKSGTKEIICSPQYSVVTYKGEKCRDDHPCGTYGKAYYWCLTMNSKDYCSPPYIRTKSLVGQKCRSDHPCGTHGYSYNWCYINNNNNWMYCCLSDDAFSTHKGKSCLPTHPCSYYNANYLWCYTTDGSWDYCCNQIT